MVQMKPQAFGTAMLHAQVGELQWWVRFKAGVAEGRGVFLQHTASQCRAVVSKQNLLSPHSVPGSVDSLGNETEAACDLTELTVWKGGTPQLPGC